MQEDLIALARMNQPDTHKAAPPDFSRRISVSQTGTGSHFQLMLLFIFVCVVGVMVPLANWLDVDATSMFGTLGMVVTLLVLVLGSMFIWFLLEERWRRWRGQAAHFSETTQVDINAHGLSVMGLGTAAWHDVLAIEGVPDSESYLIVHTRPFDTLLLGASTDELRAVISHYLDMQNAGGRPEQNRAGLLRFRALVFHWPRFLAWVWAGYLLAAAMAVSLLAFNSNAGLFKTLVGLALLVPMTAWLVWTIPFAQMDSFAPGRVRGFELEGDRLRSTDGQWDIDLRLARVTHRQTSGIGFELEFISLRPQRGRGLDIALAGSEHSGLLATLIASGILASPRR